MATEKQALQFEAQRRTATGSTASRRIRRDGWMPAIVYNDAGGSFPIRLNRHKFELFTKRHGAQNLILDLVVDGEPARKVILREIQRDHIRDHMLHADFQEISMTKKIRVSVEVKLLGEPAGVSQQGGVLEHLLRAIEVECLPSDIIHEVAIDVSKLMIGDSIFVRDLPVDPRLTLLTARDITVASVLAPKMEEEKKPEEAAAEAVTEPEVIGEKEREERQKAREAEKAEKAAEAQAAKSEKSSKEEKPEKGKKADK